MSMSANKLQPVSCVLTVRHCDLWLLFFRFVGHCSHRLLLRSFLCVSVLLVSIHQVAALQCPPEVRCCSVVLPTFSGGAGAAVLLGMAPE